MPRYVALLRAVNVGGTGKLPMRELVAMCEDAGFADVRTYIASGNVVFTSRKSAAAVQQSLADALQAYADRCTARPAFRRALPQEGEPQLYERDFYELPDA